MLIGQLLFLVKNSNDPQVAQYVLQHMVFDTYPRWACVEAARDLYSLPQPGNIRGEIAMHQIPSLNRAGSSTSKRRNLLLIGSLSMHGKGEVLVRQRYQRRLWNKVFPRFQDHSRESADEKPQGLLLSFLVRKRDDDQFRDP
jgi:hypothetical protein